MTISSTSETTAATLPANLRLGPVHIVVTDLERSVDFYERAIGLRLKRREASEATLGTGGNDLVVLVAQPGARPAGRHAGLYHFALLFSSRLELARAAKRLVATRTSISGASDHGISEALYLPDPDGNGIELAADRPRERWGDLSDPTALGGPTPLDVHDLLSLVDSQERTSVRTRPSRVLPPEAGVLAEADEALTVGHLHLHVGDVEEALGFWRELIGFEVITRFPSAAFIAAGGYHHHLGLNTWRGEGVPPYPDDRVGLRHWTIVLEDAGDLAAVRERLAAAGAPLEDRPGGLLTRDPWNNAVLVRER